MPFSCSICGEESTRICVRCTKDACDNHLCEKCRKCSDCCECEVVLTPHIPESVREALHGAVPQADPVAEATEVTAPGTQDGPVETPQVVTEVPDSPAAAVGGAEEIMRAPEAPEEPAAESPEQTAAETPSEPAPVPDPSDPAPS